MTNTEKDSKELAREGSLINLNDNYISGLAAYAFGSQDPSQFGKSLDYVLQYSIDGQPSEENETFEKLGFKDMIRAGGQYNVREVAKQKAAKIAADSILDLKVDDVLKYRNLEGVLEDKRDSYVSEIDEKDQKMLIGLYQKAMIFNKISDAYKWELERENEFIKKTAASNGSKESEPVDTEFLNKLKDYLNQRGQLKAAA